MWFLRIFEGITAMIFELEPIFNNVGSSLPVDYSLDFSDVALNLTHPFTEPVSV